MVSQMMLRNLVVDSAPHLDQSEVAEFMMDFLEHPGFLPALIHHLEALPSAFEGECWPSRQTVLKLLIGRHIDELPDSALARYARSIQETVVRDSKHERSAKGRTLEGGQTPHPFLYTHSTIRGSFYS
jgi:hypothetical protein